MLSLTIFDAVRSAPAQPARAMAATSGRSPAVTRALVANDTAHEKMVSGGSRAWQLARAGAGQDRGVCPM